MTAFAMGFLFVMAFTVFVGIGAIIFISFDAQTSEKVEFPAKPMTQRLYDSVRCVNTDTIETVDHAGTIQRWTRSTH